MAFIITTTGSLPGGQLVIPEFGNRTYIHPLNSYDLGSEFDIDEIRQSVTIADAIANGYITVVDENSNPITNLEELQPTKDSIITTDVVEGTNLYYTNARSIASTLTGYASGAGTITSSDSILSAIQKLNGNIGALVTGVSSVNGLSGSVALTGTSDRITISAANVFDISALYVGQTSITTLGTITTGVWNGAAIANVNLANSSIIIGSTAVSLGATVITITGLTSVTSTTFVGALTGNASTATTLQTARTINGTSFNGSANITVTAAAGTLTGTTLNATVVSSSLTSVGTITTGVWTGTTIAIANGGTGATTANTALNNLLPSQTGNDAKVLSTDGSNTSWVSVSVAGVNGGTVTSIDGSGGTTGLTLTGGPITVNGTLTLGGTLAIANGGTGQTTKAAAFNALSPTTTKGDIIVYDTGTNVRVPVGTNGQALIADSAQATGVRWGNASDISGQTVRFLSSNTGNSNTLVNSTAETNFTSNGIAYTMPANTPNVNSLLRFLVYGKFSTKNGSTGTLTIRLKVGSTVYVTNIINPGSGLINSGFQFTGQLQFRSIGVGGTIYSHLMCVFDGAASAGVTTYVASSNGTMAIDTTISNVIQMSAQWSTASTSNSITLEQATFEILN